MPIQMVDAIAGSGKTAAILKIAVQIARDERRPVSISLPTVEVIKEKFADAVALAGGNVKVLRVDNETASAVGVTVAIQLEKTLYDLRPNEGVVLFTTHRTLLDCPNWIGRQRWKFFVDELFDVVESAPMKSPRQHHILTSLLELRNPDEEFSEVLIKPGKSRAVKAMRDGSDEAEGAFSAVAKYLAQPDRWKVYADTASYAELIKRAGQSTGKVGEQQQRPLVFWAVAQPWFEREKLDVTIASACLTDRLLYKLWTKTGSTFVPDTHVARQLASQPHDGSRLKMICMNIEHWSAWAKRGRVSYGSKANAETPQDQFESLVAAEFGDQPFIYNANADWSSANLFPNGTRIKLVVHGRNDYAEHTRVAFMPSTLPTPEKWKFLRWLGVSDDAIRDEYYHTHAYQTVFRTALRKLDDTRPVVAVLPGRAACAYIQSKAPGSEISERAVLAETPKRGRPKKYATAADLRRADTLRVWLKRNPGKTAADYVPRNRR